MQGMSHLAHVHDIKLVIVAGIICILAAVTTFAILEHARAGASRSSGWIVLAAFVAGIGIWSTHFLAMLYFRDFQFDKVKVDKSFVSDIATSENARAIIRSIVNLGRNLGIVVVAEGVETTEQLEALRADGCTQVQGFLIGRPNPIGFAEGIIVNRRREIESAASVVSIRRRA